MITLDEQQAALALINARRAAAGLTPMPGFGQYVPAPPPAERTATLRADDLQRGQALLEKRRAELLGRPIAMPQAAAAGANESILSLLPAVRTAPAAGAALAPADPTHIFSWPQITLGAARMNGAGAIRAWELARALDQPGSGWVARKDLLNWLSRLAVSRSTRNRWVRDAMQLGLLCKARGNKRLLYTSLAKAASTFNVVDPGERIRLPVKDVVVRGWKSSAWVGALTRFTGPVSRAALRATTGVNPRSQRNYEQRFKARSSGLNVLPNYALDGQYSAHDLNGYREFRRKYAFVVRVAGSEQIAYRLPNTYQVDPNCIAKAGGQYRSWQFRLINATQVVVSDISGRAPGAQSGAQRSPAGDSAVRASQAGCRVGDANPGAKRRRYFERYRSLQRALRQMRSGKRDCGEVYEFMAGGVARKPRIYPKCRWWRLVGE
jgi:hypothetical protein